VVVTAEEEGLVRPTEESAWWMLARRSRMKQMKEKSKFTLQLVSLQTVWQLLLLRWHR